jgi:hypothetical protein
MKILLLEIFKLLSSIIISILYISYMVSTLHSGFYIGCIITIVYSFLLVFINVNTFKRVKRIIRLIKGIEYQVILVDFDGDSYLASAVKIKDDIFAKYYYYTDSNYLRLLDGRHCSSPGFR